MSYLTKEQNAVLNRAKASIRALNHPLRQMILAQIKSNGNRMVVTDIYKKLRLEQSVASQQLAIMRCQKIVTTKREGKKIISFGDDNSQKFCHACVSEI